DDRAAVRAGPGRPRTRPGVARGRHRRVRRPSAGPGRARRGPGTTAADPGRPAAADRGEGRRPGHPAPERRCPHASDRRGQGVRDRRGEDPGRGRLPARPHAPGVRDARRRADHARQGQERLRDLPRREELRDGGCAATRAGRRRHSPGGRGEVVAGLPGDRPGGRVDHVGRDRARRHFHQAGRDSVVIVDEAQLIEDDAVFEELRLLLNFQTDNRFLVTLLLIGSPELAVKVRRMKHLDQRITLRYHLNTLDYTHTANYIAHRL